MKTSDSLIYPSLTACAGALGVDPGLLRRAKRSGCPAFGAANRVDLSKLTAWLLRQGKDFAPSLSLEEAKARLAEVRAKVIERESLLSQGELVPVTWLYFVIEECFDSTQALESIREWITNWAWMLALIGKDNPKDVATAEITRLLGDVEKRALYLVADGRKQLLDALRKGPPEAGGKTILQITEERMRAVISRISEPAREEFLRAMAEDREAAAPKPQEPIAETK